jgi:hypothetical protein
MLRLDRRALRDPNESHPPARQQHCVVDDTRGVLIQWTEAGTWYPAGEQGFQYSAPGVAFTFIANVGGASAEEGRAADGRIFVLLSGLDDFLTARAEGWTAAAIQRIAMDIETAMLLWPDLVPPALNRRVAFWFPDRHPTRYGDWVALSAFMGGGQSATQQGGDATEWLRIRAWKGDIV